MPCLLQTGCRLADDRSLKKVLRHRHSHLLISLTRRRLARCIEQLKHDYAGNEAEIVVRHWNGYPTDISPVAGLFWELGFRIDTD